jgi:hypothetical protein
VGASKRLVAVYVLLGGGGKFIVGKLSSQWG